MFYNKLKMSLLHPIDYKAYYEMNAPNGNSIYRSCKRNIT